MGDPVVNEGTTGSSISPDSTSSSGVAHIVKKFPKFSESKHTALLVVGSLVVVLLGVGTGWLMSGKVKGASDTAKLAASGVAPGAEKSATEAGFEDEEAFPDTAEGLLTQGGIEGEGTHYLDRNAGPDKQVYLTSTVIDLQGFVGKNVQIWGETIAAQNAPWLMDVGKLKVIE